MPVTIKYKKNIRSSAVLAELKELDQFIREQNRIGREVDLGKWDRVRSGLKEWRKQKLLTGS